MVDFEAFIGRAAGSAAWLALRASALVVGIGCAASGPGAGGSSSTSGPSGAFGAAGSGAPSAHGAPAMGGSGGAGGLGTSQPSNSAPRGTLPGGSAGAGGGAGSGAPPTGSGGGTPPSSPPGTGGTGGAPDMGGSPAPSMPPPHAAGEPQLPTLLGTCPQMSAQGTYMFGNSMSTRMMPVVIYIDPAAKSKPAPGGPLILYYHATGGQPSEVSRGFGDTAIQQVTAAGGVVASFTTTVCPGCTTTDDLVWFAEDDYVQDDVVACAIQQAHIDTHRIHALGWSAGALHTTHVALARSNYMASIISYSGGSYILPPPIQDPNNHVASIMSYGAQGVDSVILDFHVTSVDWYNTYQPKGYYTMMCDHEMGHMIPSDLAPKAYKFFTDHPFEVSPEPYASGVPAGYPTYCKNMP